MEDGKEGSAHRSDCISLVLHRSWMGIEMGSCHACCGIHAESDLNYRSGKRESDNGDTSLHGNSLFVVFPSADQSNLSHNQSPKTLVSFILFLMASLYEQLSNDDLVGKSSTIFRIIMTKTPHRNQASKSAFYDVHSFIHCPTQMLHRLIDSFFIFTHPLPITFHVAPCNHDHQVLVLTVKPHEYTLQHSSLCALHAITTSKNANLLTSSHLHDGGFITMIHVSTFHC